MTALMDPRNFIQRELPSRGCSILNLQALRMCVRRNSSELCQKTSHLFDALNPGLHGGVRSVGQTNVDVRRDTPLGHTASAARDLMPCMVQGAMPVPAVPTNIGAVEAGRFLGVTNDPESSATLRSVGRAISHNADSTSGASTRVDSQVAGPSRSADRDPQFQQPSAQQSFSLDIGTTEGRLGRDDRAQSVTGKGDDFSRFHHVLDHRRWATTATEPNRQRVGRL